MIKIKKNFGGKIFTANVENSLAEQAEALLEIISKIEPHKIKDNFKIQAGWNIFTILEGGEGFNIVAPDYDRNPLIDITDDLTISLWIQLEQGILLNKLKLDGETISFQDKVICSKGVLKLDNIYLERNIDHENGDSGWYIGPIDESITGDELEAHYAYQLIKIRPSIIQSLVLPGGYMAVFNKDKLVAVLDENDIDILKN